ncbi:MAG TPA: N-acetyl-gamma-glutamyl-phosphate reductase [Acidimicrobiales bacterium]|nr:N-acetyl-gamma-glutamyl-phosphate reductase [Acidimicrobiales bacterium]
MVKVAIFGGSGYTGLELLRICASHPDFDVAAVAGHSSAGRTVTDLHPSLAGSYDGLIVEELRSAAATGCDLVFSALPHGESQRFMPRLLESGARVVDLAADFRLNDAALYPTWYGDEHEVPELLDQSVLGVPELFRADIAASQLVASAGCYVTAAVLALAPFVRAGAVEPNGLIVDAASGVSGAGRNPSGVTHFGSANENFTAYGLLHHRHTPEMEQALGGGAQVLFTPHLAPMTRGILATCYARARADGPRTTAAALELLRETYRDEPFVQVTETSPQTKHTLGSNSVHLTARVDERTGWLIAIAALDNLVKGAAGQAVQCANLALGLPETSGLSTVGLYP